MKSVRPSQIFEQWNYECACAVHFAAQGLSSFDAAALLVASGYQDESLDELSSASDEAVQEAWHALYGEPED